MSNRRVKSLDYDDDDFDYDEDLEEDYDGGQEEVSAEDKEQLRLGTIEVRKVLGDGYQATDAEIQDALWNYYYDIAKTVTFIKSEQLNRWATCHPSTDTQQINTSPRLQPHQNQIVSLSRPSSIRFPQSCTSLFGRVRSDLSFDQINAQFQQVICLQTAPGVKFQNIAKL